MIECVYCGSIWNIAEPELKKGKQPAIIACHGCLKSKGSKPLMEWLRWLAQHDIYRWCLIVKYNLRKNTSLALIVHKVYSEGLNS